MSWVGARWLAAGLTGPLLSAVAILAVLVFVGLLAAREAERWNLAMLAAFAYLAGGLLGHWFPIGSTSWLGSSILVLAVGSVACLLGGLAAPRVLLPGRWPWLLAWLYVLGWGLAAVWAGSPSLLKGWAGLGLVLFGALLAGWVAAWRRGELGLSSTAQATDLFLMAANLMLSALVVVNGAVH